MEGIEEMIIKDDSPLRHLPSALNMKQTLFLDAIRYCIETADIANSRLRDTLSTMSKTNSVTCQGAVSAISDSWLIIDSVNRLRTLLDQMPNLKKKSPGMILFTNKTEPVESLRNHFQHLNNDIDDLVRKKCPAFGVLEWVFPLDTPPTKCMVFSLQPGTMFNRGFPILNPLGKKLSYPVCHVSLIAGERTVCLDELLEVVSKFTPSLEKGLKKQLGQFPQADTDVLLALEIAFGEPK